MEFISRCIGSLVGLLNNHSGRMPLIGFLLAASIIIIIWAERTDSHTRTTRMKNGKQTMWKKKHANHSKSPKTNKLLKWKCQKGEQS